MKLFLMAAAVVAIFAIPGRGEDFELVINGTTTNISPGQTATIKLPDGAELTVQLTSKEFQTFHGKFTSFQYKNVYRPSTSEVQKDLDQTMIVTPLGCGVLVQEYGGISPETLIDLMVQELTKQEVEFGMELTAEPVKRMISGRQFRGKVVTTKNASENWQREVLANGDKDRGVLVVTFMEQAMVKDRGLIDKFWETFKVTYP